MKKKILLFATFVLCVLGVMAQSTETPPDGFVNLYSLQYISPSFTQTDQAGAVEAVTSKQLVGPSLGWGDGIHYYEVANYDSLAIKVTFDPEDAGKQIAFRIGFDGTTTPYIITYPTDGSTTYIHKVSLAGKKRMYGMLIYNGATNWSFAYTGTAAAKAATVNYLALKEVVATGLSITPADTVAAKALPFGLTTTLKPVFAPLNATYNKVTWESLNPDIATVDANGVVTAGTTTAGTATIKVTSVTYPTLTATYDVVIVNATTPVASVLISKENASVKMLNTLTLSAEVQPSNATNRTVSWSSSDTTVVKVDATGKVTPIKAGVSNIVVTTADGGFTDTCAVTVVGFREIPAGYTSLYTFSYNDAGTLKPLAGNTNGLGANLPAIMSSNANSLLGPGADWNRANKHVDLMGYSEVQVACTFKPEDVGKKFQFRYAFSKAAGEGVDGSVITNRTTTITAENMYLTIDLNNDPADVDNIKRVGAIKFRNDVDGEIRFNVDYVAVKTAQLASISLSKQALALEIGKVDTLTYTLFPMDAVNKSVVWTSSDTNKVTVKDGALAAVGLGNAVIKLTSVTDSTVMDSCVVTVNPYPAGYVNLYSLRYISPSFLQNDETGTIEAVTSKQLVGPSLGWGDGIHYYEVANYDTLAIKVTFDPADAGKQIAFRIGFDGTTTPYIITYPTDGSTTYIHKVSLAGKKRMYGMLIYNGATNWAFAYTGTPAAKAAKVEYLALKEVIATGLAIVPADTVAAKALPIGLSTTLKAVFTPVNATYNKVVWESLTPTIAKVDSMGVVTADTLNTGTATIKVTSVTYPSFSATYDVVVVPGATPVSGVEVSKDSATVKLLNTIDLTATVLPSNATKRDITWSSSDESVATVDATGKVTPVKEGVVYIVVTTTDGNFKDTCVVSVAGFRPIPEGYVSLYSFNYNESGTVKPLSQNLAGLGATLPAIMTSNGGSLLGTIADWNRYNKHVDLMGYSEVQVACTFKPEDVGKKMQFRYAFSKAAGEGIDGSIITNRTMTITDTNMYLTIDLDRDTADVDNLKRLGAVKFRNDVDGEIRFNVDYIAAKMIPATAVVLADAALTMNVNATATLAYSVLPDSAAIVPVTWSSSNEAVVTVANGEVKAVGEGFAVVTATATSDSTLFDAVKIHVLDIPADYTSLYSLDYVSDTHVQVDMTGVIDSAATNQLVGPLSGWGDGVHYYDVAEYDTLAVRITFDPSDAGKQAAIRMGNNKVVTLYKFAYPTDGSTSFDYKIVLTGKGHIDGIVYYNGASHWSFQYDGTPAAKPVTIQHLAIRKALPVGFDNVRNAVDPNALVDVYTVAGVLIRKDVKASEATVGLKEGLYLVGNRKVMVLR
jgi:uncharacterized protein YjdB